MRFKAESSKISLLQGVRLFASCTDKELAQIAALADEVEVAQGTVLAGESHYGQEFFVIAEGQASVSLHGEPLASLGPGDFFGEMSLLDQGPRVATVTADTPMHLLVLDPRSFHTLLLDVPTITVKILVEVVKRLRAAETSPTH